jgi:hypothetical protein
MVDLLPTDVNALARLELGGIPIATALSQTTQIPALFVRKQPKGYGTTDWPRAAKSRVDDWSSSRTSSPPEGRSSSPAIASAGALEAAPRYDDRRRAAPDFRLRPTGCSAAAS